MVCTMLVRRFDRGVTFVFFANSTLMTTSFLKLPSLPSFPPQLLALPLSRSLSFLVSLSIVGLSFLVVCDSPWWIWWSLFFFLSLLPYRMHVQYGLHGTVVSVHPLYTIVCTMLVRRFDVAQPNGGCPICLFCEVHVFLFDSDSHYYFLAFFFSLALYEECNSSSFYFALCSKKRVPFSFLVICFRWVCQLSGIQTILGHLREVLSSLSKSNHGVNTGMVCVLVDCQVRYRSLIHTLLRAQLLCAAKEGEGILRFR
jgi:hypothetical protein